MLCEECKIKKVQVEYIEVKGGGKRKRNLCNDCASKLALGLPGDSISYPASKSPKKAKPTSRKRGRVNLTCSRCGLSYREFKRLLRFGCSDCYNTFESTLEELFLGIHGDYRYKGQGYRGGNGGTEEYTKIKELKEKLTEAVEREEFERAAKIRDQLKELLGE